MCNCEHMHATLCVYRGMGVREANSVELVLSFRLYLGSRDQTRSARLVQQSPLSAEPSRWPPSSSRGACPGRPLEVTGPPLLFPSQQATASSGTVKVVIVDSVTAVVAPLLGGQQREGKRGNMGTGWRLHLPALAFCPRLPLSFAPPLGLALMMQLARELKILARDLGVAVVVRTLFL